MASGAERLTEAILSAPRSGCPHLTKNTCFSSPLVGVAGRFVSGPFFCATNPDGLASCTGTPILRFSVMLIGYMRVSSSDERQVVDLQLDALLAAGVDERYLHQDKQSGQSPAWWRLRRSERAPSQPTSRSRSWARSLVGLAIVRPRRSTPLACRPHLQSP